MSEPLALVPLAAAARGGYIDSLDARQLVAAGLTLLQRCAPLVRALAPWRGAVLLPNSPAYLVALAACEGRGAVLLHPDESPAEIARILAATDARVVFTVERFGSIVAESVPRVYLDAVPGHASFVHGQERRVVDLGSHFGLTVVGEGDTEGRDEEAVIGRDERSGELVALTHRTLLAAARTLAAELAFGGDPSVLAAAPFSDPSGLTAALIAPLLAGARVATLWKPTGDALIEGVRRSGASALVAEPEDYGAMLAALRKERGRLEAPALRLALVAARRAPPEAHAEWQRATGIELREIGSITELEDATLTYPQRLGE